MYENITILQYSSHFGTFFNFLQYVFTLYLTVLKKTELVCFEMARLSKMEKLLLLKLLYLITPCMKWQFNLKYDRFEQFSIIWHKVPLYAEFYWLQKYHLKKNENWKFAVQFSGTVSYNDNLITDKTESNDSLQFDIEYNFLLQRSEFYSLQKFHIV